MIDSKELRIGNYISLENRAFIVDCIRDIQVNVHFAGQYYNYNVSAYEPIPLTEEWLIKFGFEMGSDNPFHANLLYVSISQVFENNFMTIIKLHSGEFHVVEYCGDEYYNDLGKEIKWGHQLQNFAYIVHDVELTINESNG